MKIVEIYLQPERYNPRVQATIPGCWMAVRSDGNEYPVCADYQAKNEAQVRLIIQEEEYQSSRFDYTNRIDR